MFLSYLRIHPSIKQHALVKKQTTSTIITAQTPKEKKM
jgi:hypothetical protein